jgi:hypothetical protein
VRTRSIRVKLPVPILVAPRPGIAHAVLRPIPDERVSGGSPLLVHGTARSPGTARGILA